VRLSFEPFPVHVRTARLVAATVARRAGWSEDLIESVRLAVGEACTLALRAVLRADRVTLEIDDAGPALTAWVWPVPDPGESADDALPRAVLVGLTDDTGVEQRDGQSALRLSWSR
jgi:hypothetical protein